MTMMNTRQAVAGALASLALLLGGCAYTPAPDLVAIADRDLLLQVVQAATDRLTAQIAGQASAAPLIVASAQNNDELAKVCPQGRVISEIVSSRLSQRGYAITELRLSNRLQISAEGETLLSREVRNLVMQTQTRADMVITPTWTALQGVGVHGETSTLYVTVKALRVSDGLVLGSQSVAVPGAGKNCAR
jgi:hypothetical protein